MLATWVQPSAIYIEILHPEELSIRSTNNTNIINGPMVNRPVRKNATVAEGVEDFVVESARQETSHGRYFIPLSKI